MLPELARNGRVGLEVDEIRVPGPWVTARADPQCKKVMVGNVMRYLSEESGFHLVNKRPYKLTNTKY